MKTKQCSKCRDIKLLEMFSKDKSSKDGLQGRCKACQKQYQEANKEKIAEKNKQRYEANKDAILKRNKLYRDANKEAINKQKKEYREANKEAEAKRKKQWNKDNKEKIAERAKQYREANKEAIAKRCQQWSKDNKEKIAERAKQYQQNNKEAIAERHKQYQQDNKDKISQYQKRYYQANKDAIIDKAKQYHSKRKAEDPVFRMVCSMRTRLSTILRRGSGKDETTMELVGCDLSRLKMHIEAQFTEGMSWDNYGENGWHCDHIQPVASFDQSCPEQRKQCWHYTNLQPLWWQDNLDKSDKDLGGHQVNLL